MLNKLVSYGVIFQNNRIQNKNKTFKLRVNPSFSKDDIITFMFKKMPVHFHKD